MRGLQAGEFVLFVAAVGIVQVDGVSLRGGPLHKACQRMELKGQVEDSQ